MGVIADTCPPSDEVAVTPVLVYFQARVTFPDSVAATDADLASFVASSNDDSSGETCPCREDPLTAARSGKKLGGSHAPSNRLPCYQAYLLIPIKSRMSLIPALFFK